MGRAHFERLPCEDADFRILRGACRHYSTCSSGQPQQTALLTGSDLARF